MNRIEVIYTDGSKELFDTPAPPQLGPGIMKIELGGGSFHMVILANVKRFEFIASKLTLSSAVRSDKSLA